MIKDFWKRFWWGWFCTHEDVSESVYYRKECSFIPVIKVYHHIVCKKCGKESTFLVSEYPSCYYSLHMVEKQLQKKGIQNYEDILVDAVADTKEAVTVS